MLTTNTHAVTLRVLPVESHGDYLKTHALDANLWEAWFPTSKLDQWDKLKQCFDVLPKPLVVEIACVFAESVLPIYESENSKDKRPRAAIAAARAWIKNPCQETMDVARAAANAANAASHAANAAADAAAYAANAAARAAADAANYATYAAYAAADAASYAAYAATNAAADAASAATSYAADKPETEQNQINIVVDMIRNNEQERLFPQIY